MINRIVESCPLTKLADGGLPQLHCESKKTGPLLFLL